MALTDRTRVGGSGISPGVSLDTHAIDAQAVNVSGIITATEFHGDGSQLTNLNVGGFTGISTALVIAYATAL